MSYTTRFVGIDISKSSLDVCILPSWHSLSFANSEPGIADLIARLETCPGLERIVLEPTGGYERMPQKGVGFVTACVLIADLPEIGLLEKGQIAKLVGVAPINRDSGLFQGKRMIGGGRMEVRNALYYAALPAIRFDPLLRDFYKRLTENGKPGKVAVIAVVRKMVTILNARMRDHYALILDG